VKHRTRRLALAAVLLPLVAVVGAAAWLHMRLGDSLPREVQLPREITKPLI